LPLVVAGHGTIIVTRMSQLSWAVEIVAQRGTGQDRAAVIEVEGGVVIVVADGAGGTGNGGGAAQAVVDAVRAAAAGAPSWEEVLERCDEDHGALGGGQTTAVVVEIRGEHVHGASVGDSGAWIVGGASTRDLTCRQERKPLIGDGGVPAYLRGELRARETLLVASDGLLRFSSRADIARIAMGQDVAAAARALVALVRLPDGELQDDVAVVLCRRS
jgi:serine/threonine protein phosphatase PrpC